MAKAVGAKTTLSPGHPIVGVLRDDVPPILFPDPRSLPRGGMERAEVVMEAPTRGTGEAPSARSASRGFVRDRVCIARDGRGSQVCATPLTAARAGAVRLGDEGRRWGSTDHAPLSCRVETLPHLRARVADCSADVSTRGNVRAALLGRGRR